MFGRHHRFSCVGGSEALRKIFSNLISNAIKYAEKKVKIRLFPLQKDSKTFTIEFENDGYIINREQEETIFKPFQRLKKTIIKKAQVLALLYRDHWPNYIQEYYT